MDVLLDQSKVFFRLVKLRFEKNIEMKIDNYKSLLILLMAPLLILYSSQEANAQDTTFIQTLTFDSTGRNYVFQFPEDTGQEYQRILMEYTMRCKDGLISTGTDRNKGCGEWDYSCNTYITDSSRTDSVKASHSSHNVSNPGGMAYTFSTQPVYNYYEYDQKYVSYTDTTSQSEGTVGTGSTGLNHPFGLSNKNGRTQYLITSSELSTAGLTAGDISGLKFDVANAGGSVGFMRIKMMTTSSTTLDANAPETGLTEVYFQNTDLQNGINECKFHSNFNWDGTSNIVVEVNYTNPLDGSDILLNGQDESADVAITSSGDGYFEADGGTYLNMGAYPEILGASPRTIEVWSKVNVFGSAGLFQAGASGVTGGDFSLRTAGSTDSWRAQMWGSGFDFDFNLIGSEGTWHHYAMTYDGTTVKVYYDGALITQNNATLNTIAIDLLLAYWNGGRLDADMDELRVWDKELSATTLNDWRNKKINSTHPDYANLLGRYGLDGNTNDASPTNNTNTSVNGIEIWRTFRGNDVFKDFASTTFRPNLTFVQGIYTTVVNDSVVVDTIEQIPDPIISYGVNGSDILVLDTIDGWPGEYEYVFNESGMVTDSFVVTHDSSITVTTLNYMAKYPGRYELMSFVTPYGIGLDFGLEGKKWVFDVSDFAPILKGAKRLHMEGGVYQEEMDVRFVFISGTPPRRVLDVKQLWRVQSRNYTQIMADDYFEPRDIPIPAFSSLHKVQAVVSGHGQEGEFIPQFHFLNVDGGSRELVWQGWTECADNPIFPQGGTWIYDRAGWCPGAPTDVHDYTFTTTNGTVNLDYGVTGGSGDSRYIVNAQMVSYGSPNFNLDVAVHEVIRPSKLPTNGRINPVCIEPIVVIKNTGATELTSVKITYSVSGGTAEEFTWTGTLGTLETTEVVLPISSGSFWVGDGKNVFEVSVDEPNGGADEYAENNTMLSAFDLPDFYEENFIIELVANNRPNQNSYTIRDIRGDTIKYRTYPSQAIYDDTLALGEGCYYLEFFDTGDNGLDFWNDAAQTTGFLVLKDLDGGTLKVFENDFGAGINYAFVIGEFVNVQEPNNKPIVNVYPNPAKDVVKIEMSLMKITNAKIELMDAVGRTVMTKSMSGMDRVSTSLNVQDLPAGVYNVVISTEDWVETRKIVVE